jgi:LMBR1 domain-containing protein 1
MNGERQRQIEMRNAGRHDEMPRKDRRELDALVREEQTLVRRERLAAEAQGEGRSILYRFWFKLCALFRPVKMLGGLLLLVLAVLIWASMLITGIDKAKNSICKQRCGYILGQTHIFQPLNWIFLQSAKVFPVDYILMALLILFLFGSSTTGVATVGIRFLWVRICQIRRGRTAPQALLMATVMLTLLVLAINYAVAMLVVPQYATYGTQTFCSNKLAMPGLQPNCTGHKDMIIPCSEALKDSHAKDVCTPSMMSTFLNRITITWPFFGMVDFWTQFAFLLLFLIVLVTAVIRTTKVNMFEIDEDAEADEEESLLATTRRRFSATWEDLRGKMATKPSQGGTEGGSSSNPV